MVLLASLTFMVVAVAWFFFSITHLDDDPKGHFFVIGMIFMAAIAIFASFDFSDSAIGKLFCESQNEEYEHYSESKRTITCSESTFEFPEKQTKKTVCYNCEGES